MTAATDFQAAIRTGKRRGTGTLVAHFQSGASVEDPPRIGFAVGKSVGNSVVRHRVARRLRHVAREQVGRLPNGSLVVVRATPRAASASSAELAADLARALAAVLPPDAAGER
jgi:ribonuclease P protein component